MVKKEKKVSVKSINDVPKAQFEKVPTMLISNDRDIAMDFATKTYEKFENMIRTIVYFGSSAKNEATSESDIDLILIIDDVSVKWDEEAIATYREELGKIIQANPYIRPLHVNTVKLSTWWQDLMRGDPVVLNVLRYGEALIDYGSFFNPQKMLLKEGKIRSTPESIYTLLQRTPLHMTRANASIIGAVEGFYWACVDSAHAALIANNTLPPSPEHVAEMLEDNFVKQKMLNSKYVDSYTEVHKLMKQISHGEVSTVSGKRLDQIKDMTDDFVREMAKLVDLILLKNK